MCGKWVSAHACVMWCSSQVLQESFHCVTYWHHPGLLALPSAAVKLYHRWPMRYWASTGLLNCNLFFFFFVGIKAIVQIRCTIPVFTWALAFLSHVCTVETLPIFFKMEVGLASYLQQLRRKTTAIRQFGEEIFLNW